MPDPMYPSLSIDEWLDLEDRVQRDGKAPLSGPVIMTLATWREGLCTLRVLYEVNVVLYQNIASVRGRTVWAGADVRTGHIWGVSNRGVEDIIGCFTDAVIRLEIRLDLSDRGDDWTEDNDVVRNERRNATPEKGVSFDSLPLEFILLHEQMHAADFASAITDDARRALRCTGTDVEALNRALKDEWERLVATSGHGDANSEGERSVRRRVWAEWDRRHPTWNE